MVHRIQNRNPGYSDFSNVGSAQSFNFSPAKSSPPITDGANALKLENEVMEEPKTNNSSADEVNEQVVSIQETEVESIIENNSTNDHEQSFSEEALNSLELPDETNSSEIKQFSNGLENFEVEEEAPELFSSESENSDSEELLSSENNENSTEDDDLEIPAFLRRQKN